MILPRLDEQRRDMVVGVFTAVFVAVLAGLLALWLVAALIMGTAELVERIL